MLVEQGHHCKISANMRVKTTSKIFLSLLLLKTAGRREYLCLPASVLSDKSQKRKVQVIVQHLYHSGITLLVRVPVVQIPNTALPFWIIIDNLLCSLPRAEVCFQSGSTHKLGHAFNLPVQRVHSSFRFLISSVLKQSKNPFLKWAKSY